MDLQGNVYVADRANNRMQVFDNNLVLRRIQDNIGVSWTVCISPGPHQYIFSSNSNPNGNTPGSWDITGEIYKMELDGTILGRFGRPGKAKDRSRPKVSPGAIASSSRSSTSGPNAR